MTGVEWKGEVRSIDDLASAVERLCLPGLPILSPASDGSNSETDQQGGVLS